MTTKRRMLVLLLVTYLGVTAGSAGWQHAMAPKPGATLANFARLRCGMSIEEAHAILDSPDQESDFRGGRYCTWYGDGFELMLVFDGDGALNKGYHKFRDAAGNEYVHPRLQSKESIFDKCRRFLRS